MMLLKNVEQFISEILSFSNNFIYSQFRTNVGSETEKHGASESIEPQSSCGITIGLNVMTNLLILSPNDISFSSRTNSGSCNLLKI